MPFLPLHDINPRILHERPWVTWGLILLCTVIYALEASAGPERSARLFYALGTIPITLTGDAALPPELELVPPYVTLLTSMFLHGGLMHLIGNMLYLWVFGDNIEDAMGHPRFVAFYLICGVIATMSHVASDPSSQIPMIGASGAVSGVLGAYLVLHPKARVLIPIYIIPVYLPAYVLLIFWFAFQGLAAWASDATGGGVAWWAHIGGFVAGAILIVPFRYKTIPLFNTGQLPTGVHLAGRSWRRPNETKDSSGPWG